MDNSDNRTVVIQLPERANPSPEHRAEVDRLKKAVPLCVDTQTLKQTEKKKERGTTDFTDRHTVEGLLLDAELKDIL